MGLEESATCIWEGFDCRINLIEIPPEESSEEDDEEKIVLKMIEVDGLIRDYEFEEAIATIIKELDLPFIEKI